MFRTMLAAAAFIASTTTAFADALDGKASPSEILAASAAADWRTLSPDELLIIELERGRVTIALSQSLAQNHVAQIKALAREGFYDGLSFYRVIDGFVAQGGDVFEKREIKTASAALAAEFDQMLSDDIPFAPISDADGYAKMVGFVNSLPAGTDPESRAVWHLHCTGAIAMARGNEKNTGSTEFYIALQPQRYLDRNLTVFGRVVDGMEHLQALRRVQPAQSENDDLGETILSIRVADDLDPSDRPVLEILRSGTDTFAAYTEARRNRPEAFFYHRPNHIDVCALNVPVRDAKTQLP